jgi:hypothetical protein
VLDDAPDHVVAAGKLTEIHQRTGRTTPTRTGDTADASIRNAPRSPEDCVVAELEAWLGAITRRRFARRR